MFDILPHRYVVVNDAGESMRVWVWALTELSRTLQAEDKAARKTGDHSYTVLRYAGRQQKK